ncbi:MAG: tRNA preQ1(34) S-adenosylmethionine ribosyltransferase-isomerase QueA [Paludibacteraceae bacterium]|nr:tRNA preQ1(34) S-adenosylmethionine ribosyltransferase-isomerase QueA [Paludibacteraceae bacterium]
MKLSQFKFTLPKEQIAQYPARYRDESRLLVLHRKTGDIELKQFPDVVNYFDEGDHFLLNDTKVFPARLYGTKERTGAAIEVFLLRELNHENRYWDVLVDPARKIRIGNKIYFGNDSSIVAEVIDNTTSRGRTLRFLTDYSNDEFREHLFALGHTPLPKYIHRDREHPDERDKEDAERYQTIFANPAKDAAVAVPATGLHFSKSVFKRMEIHGIGWSFVTSHVGLGITKPIDVEDLTKHKMDSEQMTISQEVVDTIERLHAGEKRLCAVGTDVMRVLETVVGTNGHVKALDGWTNKFIFPPYDFTVANAMLANLYMPLSTQIMMVAAFGGYDEVMHAYEVAVQEGFRFGDYGDAMLIVD